jgi:hypothetical protein
MMICVLEYIKGGNFPMSKPDNNKKMYEELW